MVDSGATGLSFIDSSFVQTYGLKLEQLKSPRELRVVDGRSSSAGAITHTATLVLDIQGHTETIKAFVTTLGHYSLILGKPWLALHNPLINWDDNIITFQSTRCTRGCLPRSSYQLAVRGLKFVPRSSSPIPAPQTTPSPILKTPQPRRLGAAAFNTLASAPHVQVFSVSLYEVEKLLHANGITLESPDPAPPKRPSTKASAPQPKALADPSFKSNLQKMKLQLSALVQEDSSHHDIRALSADLYLAGASLEDIRIALETKPKIDPRTKLPSHLHKFLKVFDASEADKLPPHRDCDHHIELKPGTTPPHGPLYNMSVDELKVLRKFLKENLDKGFIRASTSPAASPVLFAKKPGGGLRFCVDYRALNAITIKNRYPLPLIQETLARLSTAKYYTKLDVIGAFNRIRMAEGEEWKTAFNTRYGLFESLVVPFGLSNAPATFQARINEVLRPFLDIFCTAYIDDILVYSDNLLDHRTHVSLVLQALMDAGLQLDIKKCEFEVQEVPYLGMIVSTSGVRMDPKKVECISNWEEPANVKDVQAFLGFANFYRRFINRFSKIVKPLVALTRKNVVFNFSPACQKSFKLLKDAFTSAPALRHFDPTREIFVETDASDWVSSGILSQKDDNGVLHPVAFMSKKHDSAECNYEIYDKELLAVVRCFECWRAELQGAAFPITVLTDHRNLEYFMTSKQLSRRQVRWSEFLSEFDFVISYRPGKQGGKPDALTRRSQDLPQDSSDDRLQYQNQALLKTSNLDPLLRDSLSPLDDSPTTDSVPSPDATLPTPFHELFSTIDFDGELAFPASLESEEEPLNVKITRLLDEGYKSDPWYKEIWKEMHKLEGIPHSKDISLSECTLRDGRLYFRDRLYVPDVGDLGLRTLLLQLAHDSVETGHPGKNKLYEIISRDYFWPQVSYDVARFVRNCHSCCRNKGSKSRYQGTLKPLPLPIQRWRDISVDFIGPFIPSSAPRSSNDCIMVVVDRLSKERHYTPCQTTMKASDLARLFCRDVWKLHGLPDSVVSDRGSLFISEFWKAVCHRLQINVSLSTAYHPETDGQTEIANAYLEQYLRQYVDFAQDDWEEWLPMAEFAANNAVSSSTGVTPFFANKGFHPRMSFGPPRPLSPRTSKLIRDNHNLGTSFADKMQQIVDLLRTNLNAARASQELHANATRTPAPAYRVGDQVFLDKRNISTARPMVKLDHKYLGPYIVRKVLGSHTYQLQLPFEHELIHDSFHASLLRPAPNDPLPGQKNAPPPPVTIDSNGQTLWAIDAILDSKRKDGVFYYLILWRGYDPEHNSWEPLSHVVNARSSIKEFERRFPKKLRPTKTEIKAAKRATEVDASPTPEPSSQQVDDVAPELPPARSSVRRSTRKKRKRPSA